MNYKSFQKNIEIGRFFWGSESLERVEWQENLIGTVHDTYLRVGDYHGFTTWGSGTIYGNTKTSYVGGRLPTVKSGDHTHYQGRTSVPQYSNSANLLLVEEVGVWIGKTETMTGWVYVESL